MDSQILSRQEIALDADAAAQRFVASGIDQDCPYVSGTEASREWRNAFNRYVAAHACPDSEASA